MNSFKICWLLVVSLSVGLCFEDKTIYQYLNDNGFTLFARLVKESHMDTTLDGSGPYTVLAPTNTAIAKIDPDLMVTLGHNDLLLKNLISYHILSGFQLIPELQTGKDELALNGQPITVKNTNNVVLLNNISSITSTSDVILNNGVVHPIDHVLIPPVFSTNNLAAELVIRDDMFNEFLFSLLITNQTSLIESGEYTIFAPTDNAFTGDIGKYFYRDMPNAKHFYYEMLRYHIVPGARNSHILNTGDILYTLHGTPIHINKTSSGMYADNAKVIQADIGASNGVIHAIDHLLFPDDLLKELEGLEANIAGMYADNAKVIQADIGASNGVIHAIDHLLFPDDLLKELEGLEANIAG